MRNGLLKKTPADAVTMRDDQPGARLITIVVFLMLGYLAIGVRLVDMTVLSGGEPPPVMAAADVVPLTKSLRAPILDRNGMPVAVTLKMTSLYADTTMVEEPEELARRLDKILPGQGYKDLLQKLTSGKKFIWIRRDLAPKQAYAVNALGDPALGFQEEARRVYPDAGLLSHVTGYTDIDGKGLSGIERYFDRQLSAAAAPVTLTIDLRVQHMMRRALAAAMSKHRAKAAIGMVMDVNTGEIISMVSLPDFDPNHLKDAKDAEKFNRATLGVFEMGSTFKLFSTAAALDSGQVNFSSVFDATEPIKRGRFTISDFHPKRRPLTVPEIFIYSSNIGTAKMSEKIGSDRVQDFYRSLGFMTQSQIELPERGTPLYPSPWRDISTITTSFGHGIAISPLHLIRAASALVNGGVLHPATLVKSDQPPAGERVISEKTSRQLRKLLELVVANGTGGNAYVEGYDVGGKTGTAEKNARGGYEKDVLLSSFLGFFPIQSPRYAVLAILDEPQGIEETKGFATGGWTAAPVVARVIEEMGPLFMIQPDLARTRTAIDREMGIYLKELAGGGSLASIGTDR